MAIKANRGCCRRLLTGCLCLALLICFAAQIWDQVAKYLQGKTSMSRGTERQASLEFPVITFCARPPHKVVPGIPQGFFSYHNNASLADGETYQDLWNKSAYDLAELGLDYGSSSYDVEEVNTVFLGRCYSLRFKDKSGGGGGTNSATIVIRQAMVALTGYVHAPGLTSNLVHNDWKDDVYSQPIGPRSYVVLNLEKHVFEMLPTPDYPCTRDRKYSRESCGVSATEDFLLRGDVGTICENVRPCLMPQFEYFWKGNDGTKDCTLPNDRMCMMKRCFISRSLVADRCKQHCQTDKYRVSGRTDLSNTNMSYVTMRYGSTNVIRQEEYRVHDFGSIVGIVGGSLGLFLGFSCLQVGSWMIRKSCWNDDVA